MLHDGGRRVSAHMGMQSKHGGHALLPDGERINTPEQQSCKCCRANSNTTTKKQLADTSIGGRRLTCWARGAGCCTRCRRSLGRTCTAGWSSCR